QVFRSPALTERRYSYVPQAQTIRQQHHGVAQQNQGCGESHQQQMLNHVHRQKLMIQSSNGGCHCNPHQEQSEKKTTGSPTTRTELKPSTQVNQSREKRDQGKPNRKLPCGWMVVWHGATSYRCALRRSFVGFSDPSPSISSREASRAGA